MEPQQDLGGSCSPLSPLMLSPARSHSDSSQGTGAAGTELEHQDCAQVSWDRRSRGKETCNKHRAFIQALD